MKKLILSSVFIGLIIFSGFAQGDKKKLTAADYDQAAKFLGVNTNKLVDRASVNPNWLPDGRMWYSVSVGSGKSEAEGRQMLVSITFGKEVVEVVSTLGTYLLSVRTVEEEELAAARIVLRKMNFDNRFTITDA